ncbi:DUF5979 domain-containing protein [uncultured Mobiluncus sp.]|uniref:DUF5979 domain-containing protein n=1 Tax=uncultured Mobiluncus sp. TaxID=293425 RepID=UPI0025E2C525|nr:DUF5979 domain-containing protein [uncultured Mobiluncus sp.]
MINRVIIQKALAIIATLALVVGTVQLVTLLVRPTPADASTNTSTIPPDYGPIGDTDNDPFTTNFPRPDNVGHAPQLTNNRVALVFNFEPSYAWETMGGTYWGYKDKQQHRNFDQSDQIIQMLDHLKGAPVSVGVYTFHRARSANGVSPNNTPNLKATSLENKDGFDKVIAKLRTLDATDGQGERMRAEDGSNFQWGLQQIRNDMEAYEHEFESQYGHAPTQPLYNNIIVFTTGLGYCYGNPSNESCRPWLDRAKAESAAYAEAEKIKRKGAHVNFLAMGPSYYNDNRRIKFLNTMAQTTGGKITIIKHNIYGYGTAQLEGLPNYDYYHYQDPRDMSPQSWYTRKEPTAHNAPQYREKLRQACNLLNPHTDGEPTKPYNLTEQRCNHVRDGKFADTVEDYLFKDKGLEITADAVDENLVYLNPIAETKFGVTANGSTEELSTGTDGIIEKPTTGVTNLRIVPRLDKDKYALTRLRLRDGNYSQAKLPAEANARCVGFSKQRPPTVFSPTTFAAGTDPTNRGGIQIESLHLEAYTYIKCGFYHRPMQESVLRKSVKVGNEQIRFDVMKSQFQVDWSCKDPYAIENQDTPFVTGTKDLLLAKQNPSDPDITLNTEYSFPDMPLGTTGTDGKTRMPVGAMCQVNSSVKYPHRCYGRDQSAGCSQPWTKADWDRLMTVDDTLEQSQYFEVKATETAPPPSSYDYGFKASGEQLTKPASADPAEKSILETLTTFTSKKASVKVRVNFTNNSHDPAYDTLNKPSTVPVYYNCRYMGDPTRPPEIPESNASAMPGYVELGAVDVPTDGTDFYELGIKRDANHNPILDSNGKTIPTWPVGTHCLFTSLPPDGAPGTATTKPWSVPGFNITDSYASTVCASRWDKHDTSEQACSNNYFWVNSQGEKSITLTQDIKRNNAQMTFTKTVSGDAESVGRDQTFTENLSCKQGDVDITTGTASFTARADVPVTVTVPAAATCTITEENLTGISDNINVTKPGQKTFGPITDTSTPLPVTTDTKFEYKTATKRVKHVSAFDTNLTNTSLQDALRGLDKTVTATCLKPGVTEPEVIPRTITGDGTVSLGTLPASTTCAFKTTVQGLDDLAAQKDAQGQPLYPDAYRVIATSTVDPNTTTVDTQGTVATITTTYKLQVAGAITLTTAATETLPYNSLKQLLPNSYKYTINCGSGDLNVTLDRDGAVKELTGNSQIPANTQCTLTQVTTNDARLTRTTTMTPSNGNPVTHTSGDTGNPKLTFTSPAADGTLNINIVNDYAVAYTNLMLSTTTEVKTSADALQPATIAVPAAWKTPLFTHKTDTGTTTSDYKVRAELVCKNGTEDVYKIAGDFTVNANGWHLPNPLTVPVGWNCKIDLNQPLFKIPGADLVDADGKALSAEATSGANFTWNAVGGTGTAATQSGLTGKLVTKAGNTADANSLALNIPYRMQLGSFNFKKKVGGEGVSMIPGTHQFKVDYSCSLNGVDIPIPTARTIAEKQDVTGTLGDDLSDRLGSLENQRSMKMGRFEQGEWHPIDALPAGAVCAVSEDSTVAKRPHSKWDNYWELTPGFRSREPIVSNCETKGTELCSYQKPDSKATALVKLPRDAGTKTNEFWSDKDNPDGSTNPIVPKTLPENFAGTMVPWNNYTFEKTQVKVHLAIDGNGKRLGAGKEISVRLYCKPPTLVANGVTIPNAGNAAAIYNTTLKLTPSKADPYTATAVSDVFVPVGYNCVLAETRPEPYDATVGYKLHKIPTDSSTILTADIPPTDPNPLQTLKNQLAKYDGTNDLFGDIDVNGGTVDGVTYQADGNLLPAQNEGILKGFRVHPDHVVAQGENQKYTEFDLTNTYNRPEANLWVNALVDKTTSSTYEENVGSQLGTPAYKVNYTCTDAYLRNDPEPPATEGTPVKYTGTVEVDSSGHAVQVTRDPEDILPATATCAFTLENAGADPIGAYKTLRHRLGADWREVTVPGSTEVRTEAFQPEYMDNYSYSCPTETNPDQQCQATKSDLKQYRNAKGVTLDPTGKNQTTITFTNTYLVQKADIGVVAYPQGDRAKQYLPADTTYGYNYSCTYPTLPGYTSPGSGSLQYEDTSVSPSTTGNAKAAQLASTIVPVGSTCTIVPQAPSADLSSLTDKGLTHLTALMTPPRNQLIDPATGLPRTEPTFTDVPKADGTGIEWSAAARAKIPDTGFTMTAGDDPRVVLHTIYRDKAKVQVRKVDKEFQTAIDTGASFKIYPVDTNGDPILTEGIEVSAQTDTNGNAIPGVFAATLAPGGYKLEETKSGMGEMLPTYWPFTVSATNHQKNDTFDPYTDFGDDLEVKLANYVSHSGLVTVKTPTNDTQPWSIDVAEVSSGYLPKTGGARLWVEITGLLMLAGGLALAYRRKTLLKENH